MTVTQNPAHMNEEQFIYLPKTMEDWPWKRAINPFYEEVKAQSNDWLYTFNPFNERSQLAFDKCDFGKYMNQPFLIVTCADFYLALLASLSYPNASKGKRSWYFK